MKTKDPYSKVTKKSILRKVNRQRNAPDSLVALAQDFGINTTYHRWNGTFGNAAPPKFRDLVKSEVGTSKYNEIRDESKVR